MDFQLRILTVFAALMFTGCQAAKPAETQNPPPAGSADASPSSLWNLAGVPIDAFHLQLQDVNLKASRETAYPLMIIDYAADGSDESAYTREEIAALQSSDGARRLVLAYLSIGEAESYRYYWQSEWQRGSAPEWLLAENPDWEGNYLVKYWDPDWQSLIFEGENSYLDKIMQAGFDGVYLDKVDSYESFEMIDDADQRMVDFVISLADKARRQDPDFLVIPQNGVDLALTFPAYFDTINGIGQEDVFYGYPDENQISEASFLEEVIPKLDQMTQRGLPVLAIAYTDQMTQIQENSQMCAAHSFLCFTTTLDLNQLISTH